ncbi:metallophosphoesterase family protein [Methylovulum miyakonense]|uniref:metallophosphoesterase family protein n=1 Tax=Methylovulum miyakonense TaxID=645578 RepID=UPI00036E79BA|nr:metallophosphoesterase [Methylovulum miyakonense]
MIKSKKFSQPLKAMSIVLFSALLVSAPSHAADPVILNFSTVGDSRQDPVNIDPSVKDLSMVGVGNCQTPSGTGLTANPGISAQDCKWLQNTKAWGRILRAIQAQKPNLLFFNGDMIMGYGKAGVPVTRTSNGVGETAITNPTVSDVANSDLMQFYKQYGFWRGMIANLMENGTYLVPVPGNHEVQCKRCGKSAQVENETAWKDNMGDLILDTSRLAKLTGVSATNFNPFNNPYYDPSTLATTPAPYVSNPDGISTDQAQLSYSFDIGTSHFVVINTDAVGKDGYAPNTWLENDLNIAKTNGAKHFFVFGHKPAFFYNYLGSAPSSTSSLNDKDPIAAKAFWDIIVKYKATYFCGHEHSYNIQKINGFNQAGSAYQVLVGAGGSPFESSVSTGNPKDRMYSWARVGIHQSGRVILNTYGFDDTLANPKIPLDSGIVLH